MSSIGQVFNEGLGAGVDENERDDLLMVTKRLKFTGTALNYSVPTTGMKNFTVLCATAKQL